MGQAVTTNKFVLHGSVYFLHARTIHSLLRSEVVNLLNTLSTNIKSSLGDSHHVPKKRAGSPLRWGRARHVFDKAGVTEADRTRPKTLSNCTTIKVFDQGEGSDAK